uniref:Uncharacterized protein n=1 Tax=viral metagenome TaxID=1070528 RepID=A0A6M3XPN1_9ZZZZ
MKGKSRQEIFDFIAAELCRRVGCPWPPEHKVEVDDYTWTLAEEEDFRQWIATYLKTTPLFKRRGKKEIMREADWIIFQYSWKCTDGGKWKETVDEQK